MSFDRCSAITNVKTMKNTLIAMAMLICMVSYSQTKVIKGTVYYQETKEPVPFAYVKLKDVAYGTVTEYDGTFSLKIPSKYFDSILEFSYVGLKPYELELHSSVISVSI